MLHPHIGGVTRRVLLLAPLCLAPLSVAAPVPHTPQSHAVPVIPHGQDWNILAMPAPASEEVTLTVGLPEDESGASSSVNGFEAEEQSSRPINAIAGIIAGTGLILAAYSLKVRTVGIKADLFT